MPADLGLTGAAAQWVQRSARSPVVACATLTGGYSSRMLLLGLQDGRELVLRQLVREPWRTHAVGLLEREASVQRMLAGSAVPVPVPEPVAVDADGTATGDPSLLMTRVPGRIDLVRADRPRLVGLAAVLREIHRHVPAAGEWPRDYQSWAVESKRRVPPWSRDDGLYAEAFARLGEPPPAYEPTFLHRDFQPGNVLWAGEQVAGVVDWVETSTGPADLDVAHCAANLATLHGVQAAVAFRRAYVDVGGALSADVDAATYWQLLDLVGFLPVGGRESGADSDTMLATWAAHGRRDLDPDRARRHREDLLRAVLRG